MAFTVEMARKLNNVDPQLREVLFSIIEEVEQQRAVWEQSVMKTEFDELRAVVRDLAEAQRRTELRVEELAAAQKRTEARLEELAAAQKRTEQMMQEGFQKLRDSIATLGSRWGIQTEDVFRRTIESLLAKEGFTVQRGYYGHREVDVVLRNGRHLLLEMTSFLRSADVDKLLASAEAYEAQTGVRPDLMIASSYVPATVMRRLLACGRQIELISPEEEE